MSELTARFDLPLSDHAPCEARQAVRPMLAAWGFDDPDWTGAVELVITELVANAVRHGGGCLALELQAHDGHLTVAVVDGSAVVPRRGDPTDQGGRGLAIIEALSQRWGVDPHQGGKRVWVELPPHP